SAAPLYLCALGGRPSCRHLGARPSVAGDSAPTGTPELHGTGLPGGPRPHAPQAGPRLRAGRVLPSDRPATHSRVQQGLGVVAAGGGRSGGLVPAVAVVRIRSGSGCRPTPDSREPIAARRAPADDSRSDR